MMLSDHIACVHEHIVLLIIQTERASFLDGQSVCIHLKVLTITSKYA